MASKSDNKYIGDMHIAADYRSYDESVDLLLDENRNASYDGLIQEDEVPYRKLIYRTTPAAHKYESTDYDVCDSNVADEEYLRTSSKSYLRSAEFFRWILTLLIGILTGLIAFGIGIAVRTLTFYKFEFVTWVMESCTYCFWMPFVVYMSINGVLVFFSAVLVAYMEPIAAGSGIPEIKCYLNGIKIPHVLRIKTLFVKALGVIFAVSGGLPVGQESTMIHNGSIIAAGISQGKSTTFPIIDTQSMESFRNDREKRDFISEGAAAGMASGFGAPIGGVLFTLEEGASFWNQVLTWRSFFGSFVATFTVNLMLSGTDYHNWGAFAQPGLISFGSFFHSRDHGYTIEQFPIFILIGIFGGFVGALFNWLNLKLTLFRLKRTKRPSVRVLEAVGIAIVTSLLSYLLSYFIHDCKRMDDNSLATPGIELTRFQFYCPNGYYNDMATLFYTTPQLALRQLFHSTGDESFSLTTLAVFCFVYFLLACWTYGTSVPSGIFVPSLLIGAAYGRIVGEVVGYLAPSWGIFPGSFALIGAATMMGGVTRMTMSLTVMLIEATNDITYGLPIMVMLLIAKWVGDWFTSGIFDTYNETKFIPFLHWDAPYFMRKFFAQDIMTQPVYTFKKIEKVAHVYKVLKTTTHNGYPIVNHDGTFCGLILRSQLVTLLKSRDFCRVVNEGDQVRYQPIGAHPVSYVDFSADYPRFPKIQSVTVAEDDMDFYMNLKPYYNKFPFTILRNASLSRVYRLFRTMGLRHIVVVSRKNKVVGIITRKDLTHLEEKITSRRYANLDLDLDDTADSSDS